MINPIIRHSSRSRARAETTESDLAWYRKRGDLESTLDTCSRVISRYLLFLERALPQRLVSRSFNFFANM